MATQQATHLIPKDIFINHIDTFISSHLGKVLFKSVFGSGVPLDEDEEGLEEGSAIPASPAGFNNNIFCTLSSPSATLSFPAFVIKYDKWIDLYPKIKHCTYFIYNINDDDLQVEEALWIAEKLYEESEGFEKRKAFVLLSTVLTWSQIQYLPDASDSAYFYDADYIRRKAHQHYGRHIAAEKEIKRLGTLNKFKFLTYVIASGITYGEENDVFHPFLKARFLSLENVFHGGWLNKPTLSVIGDGKNLIPTIHVKDLASIVFELLNLCPTTHYILAVDDGYNTLLEIVTQKHIDSLTLNLRLEAQFVHENLPFKWVSENGMVTSIERVVKEFKLARGLLPIRICILGPPLSGKSKLAQLLSEYYSVPHIHVKGVIDDRIKELEEQVNLRHKKSSDNEGTEEEAIDEGYDGAEDSDLNPSALLSQIKETLSSEKNRLSNAMVCSFIKKRLSSKECLNQGYVLDGFPKTRAQADLLFGIALSPNPNSLPKGILPACVIFLQATDVFLFSRVLRIPNHEMRCSHNDEEGFLRRLLIYRHAHAGSEVAALMASDELRKALNSEYLQKITAGEASTLTLSERIVPLMAGSVGANSLCAFFEDRGIRAFNFDVETDTSGVFNEIERKIRAAIGPPRNYGPSTSKTVTIREKIRLKEEEERRELEKAREAEEFRRREVRKREFSGLLERVRTEEDEALLEASKPLREFLSKFVMPTLTKGIFECIWRRPEDPIDYLAEYLFRNNAQVD
ncbi:Putative adenylate kinase 7 [Echinococcus granulosus]|uniref:Adenylate kinase 7 n=1 Tax=Echinococcus granulosus TaxID=6210 RepID=W6UJA6_ECHGR|nr:Putative adenylate kinase 7 [Echinococcus granulosus]EUB61580.1 Putative adenylate kinase 7 [Echinococcus granulosus]